MRPDIPDERLETLRDLEAAEKKVKNGAGGIKSYVNALYALSASIDENPEHKEFITNQLFAHIRSLIDNLSKTRPLIDQDASISLLIALFGKFPKETALILKENPARMAYMEELISRYSDVHPSELKGILYEIINDQLGEGTGI